MNKLQLSILIITKKFLTHHVSAHKVEKQMCSDINFEIILAEGDNPSLQRNHLAEIAQGEYLLFLDDDSEADEFLLENYLRLIKEFPKSVIFGGPSLLKINDTAFQQAQKVFFSSFIGIGPFKSRYTSVGKTRFTNEKELILANILIQRKYFIDSGGFNRELYPGEENEYLKRQKEASAVYCPNTIIYRHPRETLFKFLIQIFSYGKGRAKHLGLNSNEILFCLPMLFSFYLVSLVFHHNLLFFLPLFVYFLTISISIFLNQKNNTKVCLYAIGIFVLGHFSYGIGVWLGLIRRLFFGKKKKLTYLNIVKIKSFNNLIN